MNYLLDEVYKVLPDARVGRIRDAMNPYFAREDYSGGLEEGVALLAQAFADEFGVTLVSEHAPAPPEQPALDVGQLAKWVFILAIVLVIIATRATRARQRREGWRWLWMGGGWGGGRGGGGGGGGGGFGGGFGGFGGGGGFSGGGAGGSF